MEGESEQSEKDNSILDTSLEQPSKRKRGRPKKSDQPKNETALHDKVDLDLSITKEDKTARRLIKKPKRYLDDELEPLSDTEFTSPSATGKSGQRGRPRKSLDENESRRGNKETLDSGPAREASSGKKRGRPKKNIIKNEDSLGEISHNDSMSEIPDVIDDISDHDETSDDQQVDGRYGNEQEVENKETPSGGKTGRHRKNTSEQNKIVKDDDVKADLTDKEHDLLDKKTQNVKKRGRPRKSYMADPDEHIENDMTSDIQAKEKHQKTVSKDSPACRKRGRQKNEEFRETTEISNHEKEKFGNEADVEQDSDAEKQEVVDNITNSGKKRGRPKKNKDRDSVGVTNMADSERTPNRNIEDFDDESDTSTNDGLSSTSKNIDKKGVSSAKKPGRPKKLATLEKQEGQKMQKNTVTETSGKRLPGRPRKSETPSEPVQKKRGRPKKISEEELKVVRKKRKLMMESSDAVEAAEKHVRMKSKRESADESPKKSVKIKKDESPEKVAVKSPVKCAHCDEEFWDMAKLKFHMMKTHCAVWSKECPEGKSDNAALKIILKKVGKLICPKCGKEIRWIQYYRKHEEWCGRQEELTDCPVCNRPIMTMWIKEHVQLHEKTKRQEEEKRIAKENKKKLEIIGDTEEQTNRGGKKRSAAKKAQNLLHEIKEKGELIDQNTVEFASDAEVGSEESDDDDDVDDDDVVDEISDSETEDLYTSNKSDVKTEKSLPYSHIGIGLKDTLKFYQKLYGNNRLLFQEYMPRKCDWVKNANMDMKSYLPVAS